MRIVHLTPGTANFHCGSCLRDLDLIRALRAIGHEVTLVPLYLPLVADDEDEAREAVDAPLFLGGINLYLQQQSGIFRYLPEFLTRWLDSEKILRKAAHRASMTSAKLLGKMTVGSFAGTEGRQGKAWRKLVDWIESEPRPDVISLSNGLLIGIADTLESEFGVPIVCTLQGEDTFLDGLPDPFRNRSWELFREKAASVSRFIAVSDYYASLMRERLNADEGKIVRVWNGIALEKFPPREAEPDGPPVIGYLARMCEDKGVHLLVDAFTRLCDRARFPDVRLRIAGTVTKADARLVATLQQRLEAAGLSDRVEWLPNVSLEEKLAFLHTLTLFSVPANYGECFGLYVLEAMACGVPVVQPRHGGFTEIIEHADSGFLHAAAKPDALVEAWEEMLGDPAMRDRCSANGRAAVEKSFSSTSMADAFVRVCEEVAAQRQDRMMELSST